MKVKELIEKLKTMPQDYDIQVFGSIEAKDYEIQEYMNKNEGTLSIKTNWADIIINVDCDIKDSVCILTCGDNFKLDQ